MKKQIRIQEIRELIYGFGDMHLTQELTAYCITLLDLLAKKKKCELTRGRKEIWASAVICVIARMNLLFLKRKNVISMNNIFNYFKTKGGAVGIRAVGIEKACNLTIGHEGLCSKDILNEVMVIKLANGKVFTSAMGRKRRMLLRYS